jgi:hypothetical protein
MKAWRFDIHKSVEPSGTIPSKWILKIKKGLFSSVNKKNFFNGWFVVNLSNFVNEIKHYKIRMK